jgi:hypothetical protein
VQEDGHTTCIRSEGYLYPGLHPPQKILLQRPNGAVQCPLSGEVNVKISRPRDPLRFLY